MFRLYLTVILFASFGSLMSEDSEKGEQHERESSYYVSWDEMEKDLMKSMVDGMDETINDLFEITEQVRSELLTLYEVLMDIKYELEMEDDLFDQDDILDKDQFEVDDDERFWDGDGWYWGEDEFWGDEVDDDENYWVNEGPFLDEFFGSDDMMFHFAFIPGEADINEAYQMSDEEMEELATDDMFDFEEDEEDLIFDDLQDASFDDDELSEYYDMLGNEFIFVMAPAKDSGEDGGLYYDEYFYYFDPTLDEIFEHDEAEDEYSDYETHWYPIDDEETAKKYYDSESQTDEQTESTAQFRQMEL